MTAMARLELAQAIFDGLNRLFHNIGDATFTKITNAMTTNLWFLRARDPGFVVYTSP
jgi:hypothetical protein